MQRLQSSARVESLSEVAQTEGSFPQKGVIGSRACIDDRFEEPRFFHARSRTELKPGDNPHPKQGRMTMVISGHSPDYN
jgi:hypothetical protein